MREKDKGLLAAIGKAVLNEQPSDLHQDLLTNFNHEGEDPNGNHNYVSKVNHYDQNDAHALMLKHGYEHQGEDQADGEDENGEDDTQYINYYHKDGNDASTISNEGGHVTHMTVQRGN